MNDTTKQLYNQYYFLLELILREIQTLSLYLLIENKEAYNCYREESLKNITKEFNILKKYLNQSVPDISIYRMLEIEDFIDSIEIANLDKESYVDTREFLDTYVFKLVEIRRDRIYGKLIKLTKIEEIRKRINKGKDKS